MNLSQKSIETILGLPRWLKRTIVIVIDVILCFASVMIATYLRLGYWPPIDRLVLIPTLVAILATVSLSIALGAYRAIFRYAGSVALLLTVRVAATHGFIFAVVFTFVGVSGVPRTIGLLQPIILGTLMLLTRVAASSLLNRSITLPWQRDNLATVMIYGAGRAGRQLASAIRASDQMRLIGFVDDDPHLRGRTLDGLPIFAGSDLATTIPDRSVTDILLAMPSVSRSRKRAIVDGLKQFNLHIRTLPGMLDLAQGKVSVKDLKDLDIEDLLGRSPVDPDLELLRRAIAGKTIMVTGAGGSIGSELCRQIAALSPRQMVLVDNSEFMLYSIDFELNQKAPRDMAITPVLASVVDKQKMHVVVSTNKPDIIFHAAAYKHVPLIESNPVEGAINNILGTEAIAEVALANAVGSVVLISTDKAVRPTNVMGATKRFAELILQSKHDSEEPKTRFSMVRFGNVLDSNGSVVPLFRRQIAEGGPVTVTHPDVIRYFMTIREAAQLVIQAGSMAQGGEVFLLDMGEPVKIMDLARSMIELSGMTVSGDGQPGDVEIAITGLRPGEKLFEELLIDERAEPTDHPQISKARERTVSAECLSKVMQKLRQAIESDDEEMVRACLAQVVPEYKPAPSSGK